MAVALLNTNTMKNVATSSVSSDTAFTVNSGTNTCAFIVIAYDQAAGQSITAVTLGGQACTQAGTPAHNATSNAYAEVWYLVNPPTGTAPSGPALSITGSGTFTDIYYNVVVFSGVNQTTPVRAGTYTSSTGTSTSASLVVSSNTADLTLTVINMPSGFTSENQTNDGNNTGGAYGGGSDHATTAAASVTHTWTIPSASWAIAGFSIDGDPAGGGGGTSPMFRGSRG